MPRWQKCLALVLSALCLPVTARDYGFEPAIDVAEPARMALVDIERCGDRFMAVGERGVIILSDDGGSSWRQASVPVSFYLTALDCRRGQALAVGHAGAILSSADGGESWTLVFDGNRANLQWLAYAKAELARLEQAFETAGDEPPPDLQYALEDAQFRVEDAEAAIEIGPADPFLDVMYLDAARAIAVGAYGMIYRTEDGGVTWHLTAAGIDNPDRYHYYRLARAPGGETYLSGEAGLLYRSDDAGLNWQRLESGYDGSLFGVVTHAGGAVIVFGLRGNILRSEDGGASWQPVAVTDDPQLSLYGGALLEDGSLVLVGAGGGVLYGTTRGTALMPASVPGRGTLSSVAGESRSSALAVGMAGVVPLREGIQ